MTRFHSNAGQRQYGKEWVGAWILLTTDISHCYAEKGGKMKKVSHLISLKAYLFTTEDQSASMLWFRLLISASLQNGWRGMKLPLRNSNEEMRVLLYCDLWCNKSFIAMGKHLFITLYLVLPLGKELTRGTWWRGLTVFGCCFERSLWVSGSEGVPDEATSSP